MMVMLEDITQDMSVINVQGVQLLDTAKGRENDGFAMHVGKIFVLPVFPKNKT